MCACVCRHHCVYTSVRLPRCKEDYWPQTLTLFTLHFSFLLLSLSCSPPPSLARSLSSPVSSFAGGRLMQGPRLTLRPTPTDAYSHAGLAAQSSPDSYTRGRGPRANNKLACTHTDTHTPIGTKKGALTVTHASH